MKVSQNVCFDDILDEIDDGSRRVKTRSPGQILENPCYCIRGQISSLIFMNISQNVCINEISDEFDNGLCQVKN